MFWRIIRRLLGANRGRLFVMLLALGAGATVTAALLNLQVDAQHRLTREFSAFGPNVVIVPADNRQGPSSARTMDESVVDRVPLDMNRFVSMRPILYLIADAYVERSSIRAPVMVAGRLALRRDTDHWFHDQCSVGARLATRLRLTAHDTLTLQSGGRSKTFAVSLLPLTGGPDDDQVAVPLITAQTLAGTPGRISLIEMRAMGTAEQISDYVAVIQRSLPEAEVRPIRQFTEGEARIYNRINGVLTATIAVVLILTALCVMAAMTNVAMERRNDVGLMKAIGGATRRVLRLFLTEAALLGLAAGIVGAACGMLLSMWLGQAVFGIAARPRLIVYPVAVALTTMVAIFGAYPLRRLANIRPASVFRGEA